MGTVVHAWSWPGGSSSALHDAAAIGLLGPEILEVGMADEHLDRVPGLPDRHRRSALVT